MSISSLQSNLLLRCTKVWEDYVEVQWRREFSDGRRTVHYVLKAEAPDLRLTKTLECDQNSYRISGLPSKTTVRIQVQIEVAERDGQTTTLLPPVSVTARTLTPCQLDVGSVLPDSLHARLTRFPDHGKQTHRQEEMKQRKEQEEIVRELHREENNNNDDNDDDEKRDFVFIDNNEVPIAKYQMQITQIGRVLSHDIPLQEFVLDTDQQVNASKNDPVDFFVNNDMKHNNHNIHSTIENMDPNYKLIECNARYTAKCRAVSIYGDLGRWSPQTRFLTLLPVKVDVTDVGETEIAIQWGRGDKDESYIDDAAIDNLTIEVELLPSQKEIDLDPDAPATHVDTKSFSNEVRRYTIKGLESGRTYRIKTRYSNILGDTSAWDSVKATTLFPVEPCEIVVVGTNFIHCRWKRSKPASHDTVSIVRSYDGNSNNNNNQSINEAVAEWEIRCAVGTAFTSATLSGKENETRLTNLSPGVEYAIDVRAITPTGRVGLWSPVVTATVLHALQPRMIAAGESWVKVAWDRKETMFRDNIERFHVQLNCVSSPFRVAKYFPGDVTRYTFRDLKPNTRYQISLQSFSDGRWGPWGTPVSVATCSVPVPRLVRRGEEFVQIEWSSDYYEKAEVESAKQVFQLKINRKLANGVSEVQETIVDRPSYRSPKLGPLATLDVKVRSFDYSTNDWGSWGPSVSFRTLPAAVVVTHVGETVAEVSWSRIPALYRAVTDEQLLQQIEDPLMPTSVAQYQLRVNKLIEEAASVVRDELHCTFYCRADQPTTFVIPDLSPDTDYSVQISYLDENDHWSVFSTPVLFSTTPKLQLEIREIGESRAVLQWGRNSRRRNAVMAKMIATSNAQQQAAVAEGVVKQVMSNIAAAHESQQQQQINTNDPGASYRIVVQDIAAEYFKQQKENADDADLKRRALPLQFTVRGELSLVVTQLRPNTAYRCEISCSSRNTSWGTWSEPIHFMTMPPIAAHVQSCGETFISVKWNRTERSTFLSKLFPNLIMKNIRESALWEREEAEEERLRQDRLTLIRNRKLQEQQKQQQQQQQNLSSLNQSIISEENEFGGSVARGESSINNNEAEEEAANAQKQKELLPLEVNTNVIWIQDNDDGEYELSCEKVVENSTTGTPKSLAAGEGEDFSHHQHLIQQHQKQQQLMKKNRGLLAFDPQALARQQQQQARDPNHQTIIVSTNNNTNNNASSTTTKDKADSHNNNSFVKKENSNLLDASFATTAVGDGVIGNNPTLSQSQSQQQNNNNKVSFGDLEPDTNYIIKIRSRLRKTLEWSSWSEGVQAKTALATQVRVSAATAEGVTLAWGFDAVAVAEEEERKQRELILLYGQEYFQSHYGANVAESKIKIEYNFELEVKGFDDNLALVKTIRSQTGQSTFQLNGLNIGCTYGARARRQERITGVWGNFCNWHYFALVVHNVQLVEASQDWVHVSWEPFKTTTGTGVHTQTITTTPHALVLTLTGDNQGQAIQIDPESTEYAFTGLTPDTPYSVRLLAVVDRVKHDPEEFEIQKRMAQNRPRRLQQQQQQHGGISSSPTASSMTGKKDGKQDGNSKDDDTANQNEVRGAPFALPIVSSDYFRFAMSGLVTRTKKVLQAKFERVGQTFAVLSWIADGEIAAQSFEIQVCEMEANRVRETKNHVVHGRCYAIIKDLRPESRIQCSVRSVTRSNTNAHTSWCPPVEVVLLPKLSVSLNHHSQQSASESMQESKNTGKNHHHQQQSQSQSQQQQQQPPIGENYLALSWAPNCAGPDVTFEVRIERGGDEFSHSKNISDDDNIITYQTIKSPLLDDDDKRANKENQKKFRDYYDDEQDDSFVFETKEQHYTVKNLSADTVYTIRVRSKTVIDMEANNNKNLSLSAALNTSGSTENVTNKTTTTVFATTPHFYSPLPSQICYGAWSDPFVKSTLSPLAVTVRSIRENSGIAHWCRRARARFSERWWETCTAADKREDVAAISAFQLQIYERLHESHVFRLIVDEVIPDNQVDFQNCSRSMSMLRPDAEYEVCIRANTGLQWGKWSERYRFETKPCVKPIVSHVRESACCLKWDVPTIFVGENNTNKNKNIEALHPCIHYVAKITTIRSSEFELLPLINPSKAAIQKGYCILSGLDPNTSYSICLRAQYQDGESGPWGEAAYFVTQSPLEVDVANVSESFANILWRRTPQRTIAQDLKEQRSAGIRELNKMIDKLTARRLKLISGWQLQQQLAQATSSSTTGFLNSNNNNNNNTTTTSSMMLRRSTNNNFDAFGNNNNNNNAQSSSSALLLSGTVNSTTTSGTSASSPNQQEIEYHRNLAKIEANIEQLSRKRSTELELGDMHAEELDELAVYAEGIVDCIEVVCENLHHQHEKDLHQNNNNNSNSIQMKTLTHGETFCRQDDLESNTPYLVKVRTLVRDESRNNQHQSQQQQPHHLYSEADIICLPASSSSLGDQIQVSTHPLKGLYGIWHHAEFTTLKPITLFLRAVGSESAVFQWDTGAAAAAASTSASKRNQQHQQSRLNESTNSDTTTTTTQKRTAITAFNVKVFPVGIPGEEFNAVLHDANATGHICRGLEPSTDYSACVRVCYEGVQWGGWSEAVQFSSLDLLQGKIETLEENLARILVWRETGPNTPPITSHQLLVNGVMCPDPFEIERGASTVLTMDAITLDTEFIVEIADFVCPGEWQKPKEIIRFESLPKPPLDIQLVSKKEQVYSLVWQYEPKLKTDYIFWLQRAVVGPRALSRGIDPEWETLATLTDMALELELPNGINIDWYLFRLRVAKMRHTVDPNEPLPESQLLCVNPHNLYPALDPARLYWSNWSPPLRIPQPRPPEEPRNLQLKRVFATSAILTWSKNSNSSNGQVTYHVFICPHIEGGMYSCAGSTTNTAIEVNHLMPSTRYKVYLVAENNFGKTSGTKRLNFTTRFDTGAAASNNNNNEGGGASSSSPYYDNGMMKSGAGGNNKNNNGAELLRNLRGLPR